MPIDFILFGLTLAGVARLPPSHALRRARRARRDRRLPVALQHVSRRSRARRTGQRTWSHEWVIIANLACLLLGFAILSRHFEKSHVPLALPKLLPDDWKGCFALLAIVFVLSSFLDNIAAALIGGAMAHTLFKKVHLGYLAAIVAAVERRRRRQRRRRHDDDDDVDRRRRSARRAARVRGRGRRRCSCPDWSPPSSSSAIRRS